ncbi:MAG: PQQ-binding-like beta-propeller repeat protein [Ktedonobacteraceae bacterium]|nr:PQQ-binding-like beta-propeller repeat protein [Ktedonobacteraceae bacterium]
MSNHTSYGRWIALLLLFCLLGLSACGLKASPQATGTSGSDKPTGTGATPEPGNSGQPIPKPSGHTQSMVAANGIVYVGSDNGTLYALNANNGAVRWQQRLNSPVAVSTVSNGTVYVSTDQVIFAFDAASGARRWQHTLAGAVSYAMLTFNEGILFASTTLYPGNNAHAIYALKMADGSQLWQYNAMSNTAAPGGVVNGVFYSIETVGDSMYGDQHVVAIRTSDGHVLWHMYVVNADGQVHGTPVESNGILYLGTNSGALYALHVATGVVAWHVAALDQPYNKFPSMGAMPINVVDGVVYANTLQGIVARRASDGVLLWQKKSAFFPMPFLQPPLVSNERVYVASNNGAISALRMQDGFQIWQASERPISDPFVLKSGFIYVNAPNEIYALHEQNGAVAWRQSFDHHNSFSSGDTSMLVAENVVYVSKDNGVVQALRASDGKPLWSYVIQEQAVPTELAYGASITFVASVSYQQALKAIADLGLQMSAFCPSMWKEQVSGGDMFSYHSLSVVAHVNSAPLWLHRLKTIAGVTDVQAAGPHSCPAMGMNTAFFRLHLQQKETLLRVTFASTVSYNNALEDVSDLWFRLSDPCYEQARAQGTKPTWHPQGQADTFAKAHSLVMATTTFNSINWSKQLHAVPGVATVEEPLKIAC